MDPELWELTRAAVHAVGAVADAHLNGKGYRPRVALPSVGWFSNGWPDIRSYESLLAPDSAPTDHSALFGPERSTLTPLAYTDVPELVALITYVAGRSDLSLRLTLKSREGTEEIMARLLQNEVCALPLSLLNRARALDVSGEDELLSLYLERERAWLLDPLPIEYVVPLALTAFDLDHPLVIDEATRIEPLDEGTQAARAPRALSVSSVPDTVIGAATHALVLAGYTLPNPGPAPRTFGDDVEHVPLGDADLVCEALRVLTDVPVGYAQVLRRPLGWADDWKHNLPALSTVRTLRRYPDWFDEYAWLRTPIPVPREDLTRLPAVVSSLRTAPQRIRLATRRLSTASLRTDDDDRTIDACIGLEALLGEGRDELTHRIALRAATALVTSGVGDAEVIYGLVKKVYAHRSAVVHGTEAKKTRRIALDNRVHDADDVAVLLLRELLLDVLTRRASWTPQSLDAALLASLRPAEENTKVEPQTANEDDSTE